MNDIEITAAVVWETLASIPDPEFGINIVDLGLIYGVACEEGNVIVIMTLTSPSCPSGGWIHEGVKTALRGLPGAKSVTVDLVFNPPWNTGMLSMEARQELE